MGNGIETRWVGVCFHPLGSTRRTITYPVGGDGAKSRTTQAEQPGGWWWRVLPPAWVHSLHDHISRWG